MSKIGFGTYRISDQNPQHILALQEAIRSGVRLIDTSSNYMDGGAEKAIALAMKDIGQNQREEIEIISKFGYIQNSNMKRHQEKEYDEVVEYSQDCFHCISQRFLEDQLTLSLERLEVATIDCYLIHNPEYYILDAIRNGVAKDDRLDEMYKRLYDAFMALELEVQNKRIKSYGISSNSFSKPRNSEEFLPYEDLLTLAQDAAKEVGNSNHSFTTIQLPMNILELDGLKCARWSKENGLRVVVNRPLNAKNNGVMYRLADYDESMQYYNALNEMLELCDNETLKSLHNLFEQLDDYKHKFTWIGDYDSFLYSQVIPHIKSAIDGIDENYMQTMINYTDIFLQEYRKMVAYECSLKTRRTLQDKFAHCTGTLQECAIQFLREQEYVDYILVGMRKPRYVSEIMSFEY